MALAATAIASLSGCGCSLRLHGCSLSHEPECVLCLRPILGISACSSWLELLAGQPEHLHGIIQLIWPPGAAQQGQASRAVPCWQPLLELTRSLTQYYSIRQRLW